MGAVAPPWAAIYSSKLEEMLTIVSDELMPELDLTAGRQRAEKDALPPEGQH